MVYVRDRQSSNGTFVNGKLVGKGPLVTPGYLLKKGDVVTVGNEPKAKFSFEVDMDPITTQTLTPLQLEEAKVSFPSPIPDRTPRLTKISNSKTSTPSRTLSSVTVVPEASISHTTSRPASSSPARFATWPTRILATSPS